MVVAMVLHVARVTQYNVNCVCFHGVTYSTTEEKYETYFYGKIWRKMH